MKNKIFVVICILSSIVMLVSCDLSSLINSFESNQISPIVSSTVLTLENSANFSTGGVCQSKNITIIDSKGNPTGELFNVSDNAGKVSIINFWGYWCTPCKEELPVFDKVYKEIITEFGDIIEMIAIHQGATFLTENDKEGIIDYMNDLNASFK